MEVCETICRGIREVFGGKMKENYPEQNQKTSENNLIRYYFEGVAKSRKTLSIDRPGKGIERGLRTRD